MTSSDVFVSCLGAVGILWYYVCLFAVGMQKLETNSALRDFMALSITMIGVSLATSVGMLLGLRGLSQEVSRAADSVGATANSSTAMELSVTRLEQVAVSAAGSNLQWGAAILYIVSLLIAMFFW